jgi:NADH:ubiquinone oxidoreductase subunit E
MFGETVLKEIDEIRVKYPDRRSALLPSLYIAQREFGWLSQEAMQCVAKALNLSESIVRGTASFYSMFKHKPVGRHLIQLCTNVSCMIRIGACGTAPAMLVNTDFFDNLSEKRIEEILEKYK